MRDITEIRARVRFLSTNEGGRKNPVKSGYRPPIDFGLRDSSGNKLFNDCTLTFEGRDIVYPGDEAVARIKPFHPEYLQDILREGLRFDLTEGKWVVGHGTIISLI